MAPPPSHPAPPRPPARGSALPSVRVGLQALRVNPLRTFLSALGVVIGVASLVAVLSLGDGMEGYVRAEIERTTSLQNVSISVVTADTLDGVPVPRETVLVFGEAEARAFAAARVPGFAGAFLSASGTTTVRGPDGRMRGARVTAATAGADEFHGLHVKWGRFFSAPEAAADAPVAVVSHGLAVAVAGADAGAAIGKTVEMQGGARRIVGVLEDRPDAPGLAAFVPLSAAPAVLPPGEAARPRPLLLKAARVEDVPALKAGAERWLAARYGPGWRRDFTVGTARARVEQMMRGMLLFKVFMGAITAISLLVGGIGIMNVLLASVTERTREIGIRKAVGARRRDIVLQFLSESVAITGSGSLVGLLLGLAAAFGITAVMRAQIEEAQVHAGLSLSTLAVAALSALIVGVTFGTYPALRAARLSPIDAIRHE